ncbi:hypothetical protein ABIE16_003949 [Pseudomonas sp. 2725]
MDWRTPLGVRFPTLSLTTIASRLAPTRAELFLWIETIERLVHRQLASMMTCAIPSIVLR